MCHFFELDIWLWCDYTVLLLLVALLASCFLMVVILYNTVGDVLIAFAFPRHWT